MSESGNDLVLYKKALKPIKNPNHRHAKVTSIIHQSLSAISGLSIVGVAYLTMNPVSITIAALVTTAYGAYYITKAKRTFSKREILKRTMLNCIDNYRREHGETCYSKINPEDPHIEFPKLIGKANDRLMQEIDEKLQHKKLNNKSIHHFMITDVDTNNLFYKNDGHKVYHFEYENGNLSYHQYNLSRAKFEHDFKIAFAYNETHVQEILEKIDPQKRAEYQKHLSP